MTNKEMKEIYECLLKLAEDTLKRTDSLLEEMEETEE